MPNERKPEIDKSEQLRNRAKSAVKLYKTSAVSPLSKHDEALLEDIILATLNLGRS